jgi:ribosomal protein S1
MEQLRTGEVIEAEVTRVEAHGVYLQFHDCEIVVLIPDVSYDRIPDLQARYKPRDRVRVRILEYVSQRNLFKATIKDVGPSNQSA